MAKIIDKLTPLEVKNKTKPGCYRDGPNLYLQITKNGVKSWLLRYTLHGKAKNMGLGPVHTVTLAEAREKAREARKLLLQGVDPGADKRARVARIAAAVAKTFDQCAADYITIHRHGWKNPKHADQWQNTLDTYASPIFGKLPVAEVDTDLVMKALLPIWTTKTETASRLRGRIEAVLGWATTSKFRTGDNPARWKDHLENLLPAAGKVKTVRNHPALLYKQVGAFMVALRQQAGLGARCLEFAILTAARSGEVRGATWQELDLKEKHWTIPKERMKAGKEHRIPLSDVAVKMLEALPRIKGNDLVFPAPRGGALSDMTLSAVIKRMQGDGKPVWTDATGAPITGHGFRSTFRDWAGETTAHPREVIEHALAHMLRDKAEAAYARGSLFDKRRKLMADWATYTSKVQQEQAGNVIEIRGAA
jgi:integrase